MNSTSKSNKNFVVLTTQRSGSTWLIGLLNQLNNTMACDELFLNRSRKIGKKYWDSDFAYPRFIEVQQKGWLKLRPWSVFAYLEDLYSQPGAVGFKLMYSHLKAHPEILAYLMYKKISVVHLIRKNYLDILISHQVKDLTGRAHVLSGEERPEKVLIDLETETLIPHLKQLQKKNELISKILRQFKFNHIEVIYEDLVRDPDKFTQIWKFLELESPGTIPPAKLVKIRRDGHAEVIRNYNEVKAVLMDSAFANLID